VQAATDELRVVGGQGNRHGHAGHPLRPAHPASHSGLPPDLCRTLWPKGTRTPQSAVMPDPPMSVASSPVTLALTICTAEATAPGLSHHCAVSAVTSSRPL